MKIAVIGGGISGISAAHYLSQAHEVTLYEASNRLGGHANPWKIDDPELGSIHLDTGFVIFNEVSYPNFQALLRSWKVDAEIVESDMSIGFFDPVSSFEFNTEGLRGLFPDTRSGFQKERYQILRDLFRFRTHAINYLKSENQDESLGSFLSRYSSPFRDRLVLPLASLIWSVPRDSILEMPSLTFLRFLEHHQHLQSVLKKNWRSFRASSQIYLSAFQNQFQGKIIVNSSISKIYETAIGARIEFKDGSTQNFDRVVVALHADDALSILGNPTGLQRELLSPWKYHKATANLHYDQNLLGRKKVNFGCWNTTLTSKGSIMSYCLNRIHHLSSSRNYLLSLNAKDLIEPKCQIAEFNYKHPILNGETLNLQKRLAELNLEGNILFCGSYFGYGFHEDGVTSARNLVEALIGKG